ncbi:hypothetical protein [Lysobacter antibioticus]|uniref:hypothetical protein n=1 Tax=Lysobacter antibioticus TaxID=84531 RepID=UPI0007167629|nr:hypothetical protein [Lysobacter antibioticus]
MRLISSLRQRREDWKQETRIAVLANEVKRRMASGQIVLARLSQNELRDEIARRSPEQIARMERKRGLR